MTRNSWTWSALPDAAARAVVAFVACGTLLAESATCQTLPGRAGDGFGAVDSLVSAEFAKDSIGSITVGVIADSQLVWTRSVGFADMKTRRTANRNTAYRIGSITKPFTAVMLMQLVAAGRVQLSDPVERYLPEVAQIASRPKGAAPFTFLQLATMTAGLAREPDEAGPFWTGPVSTWEKTLLAALPHTRYISVPGTEYSYSNIGYAILGTALARAAGEPYMEWERRRVLARSMLDDAFDGIVATNAFLGTGYGLGFMALSRDGYAFVGHGGSVAGYRAAMYFDRAYRLGVVVFRNVTGGKQDPDRLAFDILSLLAARRRAEIQADIDRRVKAQVASPGSEAAVRRLIGELRAGKPDYDLMSSALARQTRRQITEEQATIAKLGALQSLTFKGVGAAGPNIYQATFEKGSLEWRIWLDPDGNVDFFSYRPVSSPR